MPQKNKGFYHSNISDVILDLTRLTHPNLCIVNARVGLEGWDGPGKRIMDCFLVGKYPVSVDAAMALVMNFKPELISYLVEGEKLGLGLLNPQIIGTQLDSINVQFKAPNFA
ncbi:MAG: hypothetical protein QG670_2495 [Thermoproteota archaeon]|nr:hypothetical protein [Thermoproteota archaeon]